MKDRRLEYRIKKIPYTSRTYAHITHKYMAQYKGWFFWHDIDYWFEETTARLSCEKHANEHMRDKQAVYITLGKLP